jgi:hypothetical protein
MDRQIEPTRPGTAAHRSALIAAGATINSVIEVPAPAT